MANNENIDKKKKKIESYVLAMLRLGYTQKEIAQKCTICNLTQSNVSIIKFNLIMMGKITEAEIKEAKAAREKKRGIEGEASEEEIIKKLNENVLPENREEQQTNSNISAEKVENPSRNEINIKAAEKIRKQLQAAKLSEDGIDPELKLELIKRYLYYFGINYKRGDIEEEDIDFLKELIGENILFLKIENIRYVLEFYLKQDKPQQALRFVNECINDLPKYEKRDKFVEAREEIQMYIKKKRIARMLKAGYMSENDIANSEGVTVGFVIGIKNSMKINEENENGLDDR